ncbi:MAG: hypothetical protein HQK52_09860, partial [Oligoflexia bacterium]|nr:hypothetical protein [Oligoflexia bacterium]
MMMIDKIIHLEEQHRPLIMKLQDCVLTNLPDKKLYSPFTVDDFERTLGSGGISIGVFDQEQLIAYACVLFPGLAEDNLDL